MAKILVLTKDVVLKATNLTPGASGVVMVEQDEIGLHQVALGIRNEGNINVRLQPGSVTKLTWTNMTDVTLWNQEVIREEIVIPNPQPITDLQYNYIDTAAVELEWTAPIAINGEILTKPDRYLIYVSQAEITQLSSLEGLKAYANIITPNIPGQLETIMLTDLPSSATMYICIVVEKARKGIIRKSTRSNIITFTTLPLQAVEILSPPTRIPLSKRDVYDYRILYDFDAQHISYTAKSIADVGAITYDEFGNPLTNQERPVKLLSWGRLQNWYNEKTNKIFIELNGEYDISHVWFRTDPITKQRLTFNVSSDGANYNLGVDLPNNSRIITQWNKHMFNPITSKGITHVMLECYEPQMDILGLLLFGNRIEKPIPLGRKYKRNVPSRTLNQSMGINGFMQEGNFAMIKQCATQMRWYNEYGWLINNVKGGGSEQLGAGEGALVSDIKYVFSTSHMWNFDAKLTEAKALGIESLLCISHNPIFLRPVGFQHAMDSKPLNWGLDTYNLNDTTNPFNYSFYATHGYHMAARYGNNPNVDQSHIHLHTTEPMKVGLDLVKYYEYGNEQDRHWGGANAYNNPLEFAVRMSAISDGHMGQLGPGCGVKTADPNAKMVLGGLAVPNVSYVRQMCKHWDVIRGPGNYPVDVINFHQYNSYGEIPDVPVYSSIASYGVPPEDPWCGFKTMVESWVNFRDEMMPNAEIWITEVGYDEHYGGVISPNSTNLAVRQKHKGHWLLRTHLFCKMKGIDVVHIYWYSNTQVRIEDLNPTALTRDIFITAGVTDGVSAYNDWNNRKPLSGHYYLGTFRNEFDGYKFTHTIKEEGVTNTTIPIVVSATPSVYALAFAKDNGDTCIVAWLGTSNLETLVSKIYIHATESSVEIVRFEDSEIRKDYAGVKLVMPALTDAVGKYVNVTLSECPTIIKTKNIGVPKLIDVEELMIQATSTTTIRLAWTDKNIGINTTKIFHSISADSGFILIHDAYIDDAIFDIVNLAEGSTHYYKVQFTNNISNSSMTNSIGITLPFTIPTPINLRTGTITPTSIQILWDYLDLTVIDSFNVYKSISALGEYQLLATLPKTQETYTDLGLIEETTYYYKVCAKKLYDTSSNTLAMGMTTAAATLTPANIVSAISSYSGNRISILFDIEMGNPSSSVASLELMEDAAGTAVLYNFSSLTKDSLNPRILRGIIIGTINKNKSLHLNYNSNNGFIKSAYDINIAPITNQIVTNKTGSAELIEKIIKVNHSLTPHPGDISPTLGWNNLCPHTSLNGASISYKNLIDSNGVATGFKVFMYDGEGFNYNPSSNEHTYHLGVQLNTDPIEDLFPEVARRGAQLSWDNLNKKMLGFSGLPTDKEFNIRFYADRDAGPVAVEYRGWKTTTPYLSTIIGKGLFARPAIYGLKPTLNSLLPQSDKGYNLDTNLDVADYKLATTIKSAPSIGLEWRNASATENRVLVTAYILEQIGLEMI